MSDPQTPADGQEAVNAPAPTDEATADKSNEASRPEWLPEKFNTPEALASAYSELEKKLGTAATKDADADAADTPDADAADTPDGDGDTDDDGSDPQRTVAEAEAEARDKLTAAGLEWDKYQSEFQQTGQLSDETMKELADAGFSEEVVDTYFTGQQARLDAFLNDVYSEAGDKETFGKLVEWAGQGNVTAEEAEAFNNAVGSGNLAMAKLAVRGLYAKYAENSTVEPDLVKGRGEGSTGKYESEAQWLADIRDPRYKTDPAFRKDVEKRLRVSMFG